MVMNHKPKTSQEEPEPQAMKCKRVDIPLVPYDNIFMREVAEHLRALAFQLDFWAKIDREERECRIMSKAEIDRCNSLIRIDGEKRGYYWRSGRPKAAELGWDEPEEEPLRLVDGR